MNVMYYENILEKLNEKTIKKLRNDDKDLKDYLDLARKLNFTDYQLNFFEHCLTKAWWCSIEKAYHNGSSDGYNVGYAVGTSDYSNDAEMLEKDIPSCLTYELEEARNLGFSKEQFEFFDKILKERWKKGIEKGYAAGYDDGYHSGFDAGMYLDDDD